ncbi:hypothetical protein COMNV_01028 [Commensalibacter sp. Nvir]|uniref:hypothetical protein n=1 Tax=Commensalibacter sp. Nvir TaxID=3069817 RepID=UPI002D478287|nr:hypothetical protein COMNV_01028 [Commensalibacter sp. Nvir]
MSEINLKNETTYWNESIEKGEPQSLLASKRLEKALTLISENIDASHKKQISPEGVHHKEVILANLDALIAQLKDILEKKH